MNSTVVYSDTDIQQAKLLSHLSGRPAKIAGDVFAWNGHLFDRATAIVAILKVNNQVPVSDSVKMRLYQAYNQRFAQHDDDEYLVNISDEAPDTAARIWFNAVCRILKPRDSAPKTADEVKSILVELHRI